LKQEESPLEMKRKSCADSVILVLHFSGLEYIIMKDILPTSFWEKNRRRGLGNWEVLGLSPGQENCAKKKGHT